MFCLDTSRDTVVMSLCRLSLMTVYTLIIISLYTLIVHLQHQLLLDVYYAITADCLFVCIEHELSLVLSRMMLTKCSRHSAVWRCLTVMRVDTHCVLANVSGKCLDSSTARIRKRHLTNLDEPQLIMLAPRIVRTGR